MSKNAFAWAHPRPLLVVLTALFCAGGLAQAECPCWTAEELAGVRPNTALDDYCRNDLDLTDGTTPSCTAIQVNPDNCAFGAPQFRWVQAWNGDLGGFVGPGCYMQDTQRDIFRILCQSANCQGPITENEVLTCAQEIAAFGETIAGSCQTDGSACDVDDDCSKICSVGAAACQEDEQCPLAGACSGSGLPCLNELDCPLDQECQDLQPQTCRAQPCATVDDCFPPGCRLRWNETKSDIVFTRQAFHLGRGSVSELAQDGSFAGAECLGPFSESAPDLPMDPSPGEARYYLGRTVAGVSCLDYGQSGQDPDPRDDLDATCP